MASPAAPFTAFSLLLFVLWDVLLYLLRQRGDRTPRRRAAVLRFFSDEEIRLGRAHVLAHNRLFPSGRVLFYLFFGLVLFGRWGARFESWLLSLVGDHWTLALPLFMLGLLTAWSVLHLPLAAYGEFVIERQLGLSTTTVSLWLVDQLKGLFLGTILATVVAYPALGLVHLLPRGWPLPAAGAIAAISAFTIWISPWVIAPLFNRFTQLEDHALADRVQALVKHAGLSVMRVLVMDASRRSRYLNAYFTGFGASRRVVLYDTLVAECSAAEVLSVVAHELGHWQRHHVTKLFLAQSLATLGGLELLQRGVLEHAALRELLGLPTPSSLVLLVLLPFLGSLVSIVVAPFASALSRHFERQADGTALALTQDAAALVSVQRRLVQRAHADLLRHPLLHRWYGSHPLPEERMARAAAHLLFRK